MYESYVKEEKIKEKTEEEMNLELLNCIVKTKRDLNVANTNYNYAEGELIDYYLYQIKANQSKLDYLMKKAKSRNIVINMVNDIELNINYDEAI